MENKVTTIERKILELNIRLQSLLVNSGNAPVSELFGIEKKEIVDKFGLSVATIRKYYTDAKDRKFFGKKNPLNENRNSRKTIYQKSDIDLVKKLVAEKIPLPKICKQMKISYHHLKQILKII